MTFGLYICNTLEISNHFKAYKTQLCDDTFQESAAFIVVLTKAIAL